MTMKKDITLFAQTYKQEGENDLQRYWRTVKLYKWYIMGFVGTVTLLTMFYVYSMDPIYRANTTVLIESQETKVLSIEEVYGLNTEDQEYYQTQFEILRSRDLAERVVKHLDLTAHPMYDPAQAKQGMIAGLMSMVSEPPVELTPTQTLEQVVDTVMKNLSITPVRNTQLVSITFHSPDAKVAAEVTDTYAEQYIKHHLEEREGVTLKATDWLSDRLGDLRETLQESEQKLQAYRESEELVDVQGVQTLGADEIEEVTQRYVEAKQIRSQAETTYEQMRELGPNPPAYQLLAIPSIQSNDLVSALSQRKSMADSKVTELSQRYGPKHPKMISALSEASSAEDQLYQQILSVADGIRTNYFAALQTEKALQRQLSTAKSTLQDINRKEIKLRELEREVETNRKLFNMFLTRAKETEEARGLQAAHARVVDPAVIPQKPVKPNKSISLIVSVFLSSAFAIGIAIFKESTRNTVRTSDDVEEKLGTPLLGFLPRVAGNKSTSTYHSFLSDPQSHFAESMRTVRTSFVLSNMDNNSKVVLVSSSVPDEGKSTVALNLAEALGSMEKVLLIDADLRRPSLTKVLSLDHHLPGLTQLISGKCSLKECIFDVESSSISVITTGNVQGVNPLEIVSSKRIGLLIKQLAEKYDRIIIDSPPIHAVSDALVLAAQADSVMYVVKCDDTPAPVAAKGIKNLRAVGAKVAGVVLNQVNVKKAAHYGGDAEHYFSDYGYSRVEAKV